MANDSKPTNKPQKADDAPTAPYEVLSPLSHDGKLYAEGDTVELTKAQAAPLLGTTVKAKPAAA